MKTAPIALLCSAVICLAQYDPFSDPAFVGQQYAPSTASNTQTNGIAAYWAGSDTSDSSGNGHTLTLAGAATYGLGKVGNCLTNFMATTDYFSAADATDLSALDSSLTIVCWAKMLNDFANRTLIAKGSASKTEWELRFNVTDRHWMFNVYTNAATLTTVNARTNTINTGAWYFLVAQIDTTNKLAKIRWGSGSTLYDWWSSETFGGWGPAGSGTNTTAQVVIGISGTLSSSAAAAVDEIGIWNRLLSDNEITNIFNSGTGKTWPLTP